MDKQQAALEKILTGERMTLDGLEAAHGSNRTKQCFKFLVALVGVMGLLIVVLVTALIFFYLRTTPSCNQEAPPKICPAKVKMTYIIKESDFKTIYDIFSADRGGTYSVYGWVKFLEVTGEPFTLIQRTDDDIRTMETKSVNHTNIFFYKVFKLTKNTKLSLDFSPSKTIVFKESCFHVCYM
ncbi:hypothetical protein ATANTOWER_018105 [Ataeniobius toweri]|uniref:Uncharacterized protein n=1 Tax=Ataeniobius toweri TaxID=208326 RepID=A0ABU7BT88_9TELE|nr:hypothetical protein [Ataeniobius toweri]